jgi:hypothetical protein
MSEYLEENNLPPFSEEVYERFQAYDKIDVHDHAVGSKDSSYPTIYLEGIVL